MPDGQSYRDSLMDPGLSCLGLMLRFFNLPADLEQICHDHGKVAGAYDAGDIIRCAKRSGLLARLVTSRWERLERAPLPAIAEMADGSFAIFAGVQREADGETRLLVQDPSRTAPDFRKREEICSQWSGRLIFLTHREALAGAARHFDLSWFVPAVIRYRRLLGEVLLASFFVQLMGLVTPIFFQVVTDKVLVHRGLSSLEVLMVGLAVVSLFEVLLGAVRSYVFSHTTSRIDVELGAQLFRHLMGLPMGYFAVRPAGTTVARVRELENIRNFLTGSALTLLIDAAFTVVFFTLMFTYSQSLTLIVLATVPLYAGLSLCVSPLLRRRIEERFRHGSESQAFLFEAVSAAETCKAMAVEPQMQRRWEGVLAAYVSA